jgi:hypothetical protein
VKDGILDRNKPFFVVVVEVIPVVVGELTRKIGADLVRSMVRTTVGLGVTATKALTRVAIIRMEPIPTTRSAMEIWLGKTIQLLALFFLDVMVVLDISPVAWGQQGKISQKIFELGSIG